ALRQGPAALGRVEKVVRGVALPIRPVTLADAGDEPASDRLHLRLPGTARSDAWPRERQDERGDSERPRDELRSHRPEDGRPGRRRPRTAATHYPHSCERLEVP